MASKIIRCDDCGHPVAVRLRENGTAILPFDGFECAECGGERYSFVEKNRRQEIGD